MSIVSAGVTAASNVADVDQAEELYGSRPTSILHRTPWRPPVARSAEGIYINLEDGTRLLDAVGGAAVSCIGMGNETVKNAIKEQVDKVPC
jgi:adenosylmethionine-8-amino-7-oxononanoate aminotransferase